MGCRPTRWVAALHTPWPVPRWRAHRQYRPADICGHRTARLASYTLDADALGVASMTTTFFASALSRPRAFITLVVFTVSPAV